MRPLSEFHQAARVLCRGKFNLTLCPSAPPGRPACGGRAEESQFQLRAALRCRALGVPLPGGAERRATAPRCNKRGRIEDESPPNYVSAFLHFFPYFFFFFSSHAGPRPCRAGRHGYHLPPLHLTAPRSRLLFRVFIALFILHLSGREIYATRVFRSLVLIVCSFYCTTDWATGLT